VLHDYLLVDKIGEGAFGVAWRAVLLRAAAGCRDRQQLLRDAKIEKVVVKRFKVSDDVKSAHLGDFEAEFENCERMRELKHDNVLCYRRSGNDPALKSLRYLVFDLCDGGDLRRFIEERKAVSAIAFLSATEAAAVCFQLSSGIYALHNAGLVHRDLALRNVFWKRADADVVQFKIGDFGLCTYRSAVSSDSSSKVSVHNPADEKNVAPEDRYALKDVFGLAVVLFELLTLEKVSIDGQPKDYVIEDKRQKVSCC
jgi:serine/threonine protein kinase